MADLDQEDLQQANEYRQNKILKNLIEKINAELEWFKWYSLYWSRIQQLIAYVTIVTILILRSFAFIEKFNSILACCEIFLLFRYFFDQRDEAKIQQNIDFIIGKVINSLETNTKKIEEEYSQMKSFKCVTLWDSIIKTTNGALYCSNLLDQIGSQNHFQLIKISANDTYISLNHSVIVNHSVPSMPENETSQSISITFQNRDFFLHIIPFAIFCIIVCDFPRLISGESHMLRKNKDFVDFLEKLN